MIGPDHAQPWCQVLALLDPDKAGVTAKETFVEWAGSILNDSEQMSAIADYYEELEGITGTQPLATKKGLRHIFEKVGECLAEETEAVEVEIKKRKEAKRLQKQIIATNDVYDAKVAERNEIEARREQEKLEAAKAHPQRIDHLPTLCRPSSKLSGVRQPPLSASACTDCVLPALMTASGADCQGRAKGG